MKTIKVNLQNFVPLFILSLIVSLLLAFGAACSPFELTSKDQYAALADSENAKAHLQTIQIDYFGKQVGAVLSSPLYQSFSANSFINVEGSVKKYKDFKSPWIMIVVKSDKKAPEDQPFYYYVPIKDGKFKQRVLLFNGQGNYSVEVDIPSSKTEYYYLPLASFQVKNVNPALNRDVDYSTEAITRGLQLDPALKGYMDAKGFFTLKGKVNKPEGTTVLIKIEKGSEKTTIEVPVTNGAFSQSIPFPYGKGVYKTYVMLLNPIPDYYKEAAYLLVNNVSNAKYQPIEFTSTYDDGGFTLESPQISGTKTNLSYNIKGSINPKAPHYKETNIVFVDTQKGNLEAAYAIPVKNNHFNGPFYLRFGPGQYEVTVMAPDPSYKNGDYMQYEDLASFEMQNTNPKDERYILPSSGIQSDNPEIKQLAKELTKGITTPIEKAQAIYEYVAKNINYDVNKLNNSTFKYDDSAVKTLHEKKGVCEDYAYLTIALLRASGMEAQMVIGTADEDHAWVETNVNGRWLTMDPTWGAGYIENNQFVKDFTMDYFDPDPNEFSQTHTKQGVQY